VDVPAGMKNVWGMNALIRLSSEMIKIGGHRSTSLQTKKEKREAIFEDPMIPTESQRPETLENVVCSMYNT
jgi:hypothetical protein